MRDQPEIKAVEMTRRIRDAHYAELENKTPEERISFYREKARALHSELGVMASETAYTSKLADERKPGG